MIIFIYLSLLIKGMRYKLFKSTLVQIVLLVLALSVAGRENQFYNFNTGNGKLMHNTVEAISRDHFGYLWVGTNYGLNRLDSYETINFVNNPDDKNSISSNSIRSLFTDSRGILWIGTIGGGLNKYNRSSNNFTCYLPNDSLNSISGSNISSIIEDLEGNIWIATIGNGLNKYNYQTGLFTHYNLDKHNPIKRKNTNINRLFLDREGNIWAGLSKSEIFKINPRTDSIAYFGLPANHPNYNVGSITGITQNSEGTLLFSTWNGKILSFNAHTDLHADVLIESERFNYSILSDIITDKYSNIWVSTWGNGLFKIDKQLNISNHYLHKTNQSYSIGSSLNNRLFIDNDQNLWICMLDNGISMLPIQEKMFNSITLSNERYETTNVFSIVKDNEENLWIGTRGQGIWKYKNNKSQNFNTENHAGLKSNAILSMIWSTDNRLIIGTDGDFVSIFNPKTQEFTSIKHLHNDWSNAVFSLAENKDFIWAGTWGGGIKKIDKKTLTYETINFDQNDQFRNSIFDLKLSDSILWISNVGLGLIKFNVENNHYIVYSKTDTTKVFPQERITHIEVENGNSLWLTTDGSGLYQFIPDEQRFVNASSLYDLNSSVLQSCLIDQHNNLWVTSLTGIFQIDRNNNTTHSFSFHNGLTNGQLNKSSVFYDQKNDKIFLGGVDGLNYFTPSNVVIDTSVNRVTISKVSIMGETITGPNGRNTMNTIDVADKITIGHEDEMITLYFTDMDFTPSPRNKYLYQLDGFDKDWVETSHDKNFVQYTNLRPGKYTFRVKSCNSDGVCSNNETTLRIIARPAFWQTIVFNLTMIFLILFVIFLYFHRRNISLLKSKKILEKEVADRTTEILKQKIDLELANNAKDKLFSVISHDLRGPLISINQFASFLETETHNLSDNQINDYYILLRKTSTSALDLVDNLLLWSKYQSNSLVPEKTNVEVQFLLNNVSSYYLPIAISKGLKITLPETVNYTVYVDVNMILAVLRNLIGNAVKFSHPGGEILIKVLNEDDVITIAVMDSGVGMTDDEISKIFTINKVYTTEGTSGEKGSGLGLILCQDFIKLNKGKIWVESKKGKGSSFFIALPTNNK